MAVDYRMAIRYSMDHEILYGHTVFTDHEICMAIRYSTDHEILYGHTVFHES